jgi:hypothetical protein
MSEDTGIDKLGSEILRLFFILAGALNRKGDDPLQYFTMLQTEPGKEYIQLQQLLDGKQYQLYSVKDIERSLNEIIRTTDMYNNLTLNADTPYGISAGSVFTPELFNKLGGYQSDILLNTMDVSVLDEKSVQLHFLKGASEKGYSSLLIEKQANDNNYSLVFTSERKSGEFNDVKGEELAQTIKNEASLNDKAYLHNKTGKKLFSTDEIPKDVLKEAGIKWNDLSETNKKALLEGRETSMLTIKHKFGNAKQNCSRGFLQLSRIGGNRAQFMFRPAQNVGMKMTMKL